MKLLILLVCTMLGNIYAQSDLASIPVTNEEIIENIWVSYVDKELDPIQFYSLKSRLNYDLLSEIDKIKLEDVEVSFSPSKSIIRRLISKISRIDALKLISSKDEFTKTSVKLSGDAMKVVNDLNSEIDSSKSLNGLSKKKINELLVNTPDAAYFRNGKYKDTVKLFLFCRKDRNYPCLFLMKDIFGKFVKTSSNKVWSLPSLAKSARNISFNKTNGETPTGVHTIDSVMPSADRQRAFGKFRRLILNWIPSSRGDSTTKSLVPSSHHSLSWWKQASIARDAGRLYLRIHGTGKINTNPLSKYYPHMPTSGCISTREGKYRNKNYIDQRVILDTMMKASRLSPIYSNETRLKGLLWVINIDDEKRAVNLRDLSFIDFNI